MTRNRRRRQTQMEDPSRRDFIRAAGCAALTATSIISTVWDLRMVNAAVADKLARTGPEAGSVQSDGLHLPLSAGNDANNMIVPRVARHAIHPVSTIRGNLAIPNDVLLPTISSTRPVRLWHAPGLRCAGVGDNPGLIELFDEQKLAVISNVGTLCYPTTKADIINKAVPLPSQMFSHSDQQVQWQTSVPDRPSRTGWGGRCADLLYSMNDNNPSVSMSLSLAGINTWEVGKIVNAFNVGTNGARLADQHQRRAEGRHEGVARHAHTPTSTKTPSPPSATAPSMGRT